MKNKRRLEKYDIDKNEWIGFEFKDLKDGDKFRMFDGNIPIKCKKGNMEFVAMGDAFFSDNKWSVNIKD